VQGKGPRWYCRKTKSAHVSGINRPASRACFWQGENSDHRPTAIFVPRYTIADGPDAFHRAKTMGSGGAAHHHRAIVTASFRRSEIRAGFGYFQRDRKFSPTRILRGKSITCVPARGIETGRQFGALARGSSSSDRQAKTNDNIVAFWVCTKPSAAGEEIEFEYKVQWFSRSRN